MTNDTASIIAALVFFELHWEIAAGVMIVWLILSVVADFQRS